MDSTISFHVSDLLNVVVAPLVSLVIWILKKIIDRLDETKEEVKKAIEIGEEMREKSEEIVILQRNLKTAFRLIDELKENINEIKLKK